MIALLFALTAAVSRPASDTAQRLTPVSVRLDDRHNTLAVTIGPFRVAPSTMNMHGSMDMGAMTQAESLMGMWQWPTSRRFHGVSLAVVDAQGKLMDRHLLHHTYMVNFDRRQLLYPIFERTFSFGEETSDVIPPATIGLPMVGGQHMGIIIMWNNEHDHDVDGVYVRYTFHLNPRHQWPRPTDVMPFFVDAHLVVGGVDTFNVPPGGRSVSYDFTMPIDGHLLAAGGHLHDHAVGARIEDRMTGRDVVAIRAVRDATGDVSAVTRAMPALWRGGVHLRAGRGYRLVVTYDNPSADTLRGMMGMMGGIIVPDHPGEWPAVDRSNPVTLTDLHDLYGSIPTIVAPATARARN